MKRVEIHLKERIDNSWSDRMGGLNIVHTPDGYTVLSGLLRDQCALYGLLNSLAGLGLEMVSATIFDTFQKHNG